MRNREHEGSTPSAEGGTTGSSQNIKDKCSPFRVKKVIVRSNGLGAAVNSGRAWVLTSIDDGLHYGGNTGYSDDPATTYRYDSTVPNHKQLSPGDLVFIRNRRVLTGVAVVENVTSAPSTKVRQRCPSCGVVNIKERATRKPIWRCRNGHEFADPVTDLIPVIAYAAEYGGTFVKGPPGIVASALKAAALRPNDQLAIEEVDPNQLASLISSADTKLMHLFARNAQSRQLEFDEGAPDEYRDNSSIFSADTRLSTLRAIKARRGQRSFRRALIRRYGESCMISGCQLLDIVEAAHIWPYRGEHTNNVQNGLLLRSDLHTLFDLDLLGITAETLTIHFHPIAAAAGYASFEGQKLSVQQARRPAQQALRARWDAFLRRLSQQNDK